MSGVEPNKIDYQGFKIISEDDTQSITFKMAGIQKGLILEYDLTTLPKQFHITPSGVEWTNGTNTYNTALSRLALVQTAFSAIELPPNATTLKINDTILLDDLSGNSGTLSMDTSGDLVIDPSNNVIVASNLDMSGNNIIDCPSLQNTSGNVELKCNTTGAGGSIVLTGGTGLLSVTAGGNSSQYLVLTINGTAYKIALLNL
jgi:hypothetical protein